MTCVREIEKLLAEQGNLLAPDDHEQTDRTFFKSSVSVVKDKKSFCWVQTGILCLLA